MKKVMFLLPLFIMLSIAVASAQCCKAGMANAGCSKASTAATSDPSIEKRQAEDGTVAFVRKEADQQGNVRFVSVQYDESTNKFVNINVAPRTMTAGDKAEMVKKGGACSAGEKKACCAGKESGKACAGEARVETNQ